MDERMQIDNESTYLALTEMLCNVHGVLMTCDNSLLQVANLYLLAKPTHEWYLAKFKTYPKTRHALFPSFRQIRAKKD